MTKQSSAAGRQRVMLAVLGVLLIALVSRPLWWPGGAVRPLPLPEEVISSEPLAAGAAEPAQSTMRFTRLDASTTGIDHVLPLDLKHPMKYLYFSGTMGGGVAVGDVDNDGRPDIFLVNGPRDNRLYRQTDDWKFEDITESAGVGGGENWGVGATMADINNDGRLDIYVCNFDSPNELYINLGNGRFEERAVRYGLNLVDASMLGSFADYDRDGDLDLYMLTYRYERPQGRPRENPVVEQDGKRMIHPRYEKYYKLVNDELGYEPVARADGLLRNEGEKGFVNVTEEAGIRGLGHGLSATWWDYNQDGWPDLYVANDFMDADQLYRNNGDGTFSEVITDTVPHTTWYSMGADAADLNNDGKVDLVVADMSATTHYKQKVSMGSMGNSREFLMTAVPRQYMRNTVFLNSGAGRMLEAAYLTGLDSSDWTWTVKTVDLDCDGNSDVYFTNGSPRDFTNSDIPFSADMLVGKTNWDLYEDTPPRLEKNLAFRNLGDLRFEDVSDAWGLGHVGISLAAAHSDLDGDGDLDMVVSNLDEPVSIYRNEAPANHHRLVVRLVGVQSNRFGLGATIRVRTDSGEWTRELFPAAGFLSSNEPIAHFGLGEATVVRELTIEWPSGIVQTFHDLEADRQYTIREEGEPMPPQEPRPAGETLFVEQPLLAGWRHRERPYDDYQRQPLLPNQLSQLGPGMAWGDADGDGDDDLYIGGAAGQAGLLLEQQGPGKFRPREVAAFEEAAECEDMAALWLDVDGDGDQDLYVVSGGYEFEVDDPRLRDRLYLNQGGMKFTVAGEDQVPAATDSGSAVAAADVDRDGDLDLFVGGRMIPGSYPMPGRSRIFRNDGGRLVDATSELAPAVEDLGMVTSGLWSDVNHDGWIDLLVTQEWGAVRCLTNNQGKLVDQTDDLGLGDLKGWWNSIAAADVDHDGDVDYVIANFGLNTKYHASKSHPTLLYYGDFQNNGQMQIVEAEFEDETLFPIRGKSCSTAAMPILANKFPTYHSFALASLQDIYTENALQKAYRLEANELRSGILLNQEGKGFEFKPLPRLAQIAPTFGMVFADLNHDRNVDMFMAQNFYSPQPETGRMAGGLSLLLLGDGSGEFQPVWPDASGILMPGDAKSAAAVDLDGNGALDLVIANNDASPTTLLASRSPSAQPLRIQLAGPPSNPTAIGARILARYSDGLKWTHEVYAGGGYLSQAPATLFIPDGKNVEQIEVLWPDGKTSTHSVPEARDAVWVIAQPEGE